MNLQWDTQTEMAGSLAGFRLYAGRSDRTGQVELLAAVRAVLQTAPLFTPRMPNRDGPSACACRIADRSAGSPTKAAIAIDPRTRRPAGPGRLGATTLRALSGS